MKKSLIFVGLAWLGLAWLGLVGCSDGESDSVLEESCGSYSSKADCYDDYSQGCEWSNGSCTS